MQKSVLSGTNEGAYQSTINNIAQLRAQMVQAAPVAVTAANGMKGLGAAIHNLGQQNLNQLSAALKQQEQDLKNVSQGAALLATTYGTSLQGALALADLANVKLANGITGTGQAAQIAGCRLPASSRATSRWASPAVK